MKPGSRAIEKYLGVYADRDLPACIPLSRQWQHVLVIPCYAEDPGFISTLPADESLLIVLVLNRPVQETDSDINQPVRTMLERFPHQHNPWGLNLFELSSHASLLALDLESLRGPLAADRAVGSARKAGCDLALKLIDSGHISSPWICCSDADALLPADYFSRLPPADGLAACIFGFCHQCHQGPVDQNIVSATQLYELSLHYYVLGLGHANSPYAFHTLGSCIAINHSSYAQVRGFPRRAGGEDFYLLNKLAKVSGVQQLRGLPILLQPRRSQRVPFGTGPAVEKLLDGSGIVDAPIFYHPHCFEVMRLLMDGISPLACGQLSLEQLMAPLEARVRQATLECLLAMDWSRAIGHCLSHSHDEAGFRRHFHHWFDGFRTLKLIQTLTRRVLPKQSLKATTETTPLIWPICSASPGDLSAACQRNWSWHAQGADTAA